VIDLIRAELLKLTTTRMIYGFVGALLVIIGIIVVVTIIDTPAGDLAREEEQAGVYGAASTGIIFMILLGVMIMSGEFRHGTITQTLLITPNRWKVLAAKVLSSAIAGFVIGVIAEVFTLVLYLPLLASKGVDILFEDEARSFVIGSILVTTLSGPLGVAVGSLMRNQVAAIIVVFATLLIVEPIVSGVLEGRGGTWEEVPKYFPGHLIGGVIGDDPNALSRGASVAVMVGYVLVLSALGGRLVLSRDVNSIQA
jgi:ABC-2 type transport system permease protein